VSEERTDNSLVFCWKVEMRKRTRVKKLDVWEVLLVKLSGLGKFRRCRDRIDAS